MELSTFDNHSDIPCQYRNSLCVYIELRGDLTCQTALRSKVLNDFVFLFAFAYRSLSISRKNECGTQQNAIHALHVSSLLYHALQLYEAEP